MEHLRDIDLGTPEIRARHFGWEIPVAIVIAIAVVALLLQLGVRVELWESGVKWYRQTVIPLLGHAALSETKKVSTKTEKFDPGWNPFLESPNKSAIRYHPCIGETVPSQAVPNFARDYFGFRNKKNLYFTPCECHLVVVSGNSEVAGTGLLTAWTTLLERILNERSDETWRVLNLGMSGITSAYEVNFYVNLAYDLKPDFVISHSLVSDVHHGTKVPKAFRKVGLIYIGEEETWARKIHGDDIAATAFNFPYRGKPDHVLDAFLTSIKRYKSIVEGNGGKFILGIPRYEMSKLKGRPGSEFLWPLTDKLHNRLAQLLESGKVDVDYIDFNKPSYGIETAEGVHTSAESAPKVAKIYADRILKLWSERH